MKNRKKLFLHIGTHKTGSTTIQDFLKNNRSLLKKNKIALLGCEYLYSIFRQKKYNKNLVRKCKKIVSLKAISLFGEYTYLVTNETFSGDPALGYSNAGIVAQMLADIFSNFDIRIIVYLRRQDLFIESIYTQYIHEGGVLSFDEYLKGIRLGDDFNWENLVDSYGKIFSQENIVVRVFEKERLHNRDLVGDFLNIIDCEYDNKNSPQIKNVGYTGDVLEVARCANKYLDGAQRKRMRIELQRISSIRKSPKCLFFNPECRKNIIDTYAKSNSSIFNRYLDPDKSECFSRAYPDGESFSSISNEAFSQIFIMMLMNIAPQKDDTFILSLIGKIENSIRKTPQFLIKLPKMFIKYILLGRQ